MLSFFISTVLADPPGPPAGSDEALALSELDRVFAKIVEALVPLGGIILLVMLFVGGFMFITAGGDPKKAGSAKNTLTFAIGGIVVVALSFLILRVIASFSGINRVLFFSVLVPS